MKCKGCGKPKKMDDVWELYDVCSVSCLKQLYRKIYRDFQKLRGYK